MSYDLHGTWDINNTWVGPYVNSHTNMTEIQDSLDLLWRNDILPQNVNLGLAFYGRSFTLADPNCFEPGCIITSGGSAGPCSGTVSVLLNTEIAAIIAANSLTPTLHAAAAVKTINWENQWVAYDDGDTFKLKADIARSQCIGGVMVWAASHDDSAGTSAYALATAIGRPTVTTSDHLVRPGVFMDASTSQVEANTCRWTNCGETCPAGFKTVVAQNRSPDLMLDDTGCWSGVHTFCCPTSQTIPTCTWRGTPNSVGKCSSGCNSGEVEVSTLAKGCTTDHQSACCTTNGGVEAYTHCKWVGAANSCAGSGKNATCPSDYPKAVVSSSKGAGGEQTCQTGAKTYCCQDPIPDQFQDCAWYRKGDSVGPASVFCQDSCPSGQMRVARQHGSCPFLGGSTPILEAYCCKGVNNIPAPAVTTLAPRSPLNSEFQAMLSSFYNSGGTCSPLYEGMDYSPYDPSFKKRTQGGADYQLTMDLIDRLATGFATTSPGDDWIECWNTLAGSYNDISYDEVSAFLFRGGSGPTLDPEGFSGDLLCNLQYAGSAMNSRRATEEALCDIDTTTAIEYCGLIMNRDDSEAPSVTQPEQYDPIFNSTDEEDQIIRQGIADRMNEFFLNDLR